MITLLIKRIVVLFMAVLSFFNAGSGKNSGDYCGDYDFPRISAGEQENGTVRIMSFNIRCADVNGVNVPDRLDIGIRQILEVMPDSLGIQEATPQWMKALDKALAPYGWVGLDRETGAPATKSGESCPIFYLKTKFKLVDSGSFWVSDTPDVPSKGPGAGCIRICTWVKLKDRQTGSEYVHVNTHYDHVSEEARVQGAAIVTRYIEEHFKDIPVVFTADMNTSEKGEAYAKMTENLADARFAAADCETYGTFHAGKDPNERADYYIDFILCSKDINVNTYKTLTNGIDSRFVSDHFPIYSDVVMP